MLLLPDFFIFWVKDSLGAQKGTVDISDGPSNSASGGELTQLEQILKKKTFTRQVVLCFGILTKMVVSRVLIAESTTCTVVLFHHKIFVYELIASQCW